MFRDAMRVFNAAGSYNGSTWGGKEKYVQLVEMVPCVISTDTGLAESCYNLDYYNENEHVHNLKAL